MKPILVVDDDALVLKSVCQVLEDDGFEVIASESGQAALRYLQKQTPALIILDVIMPDLNGIEICRRLKADPIMAKIPIIFLTAKGRPIDRASGLDLGADDYIVKPYEVLELPARVRAVLRRSPGSGGLYDATRTSLDIEEFSLHLTYPRLMVGDTQIDLTTTEHRLVYFLMTHAGEPLSVDSLLQNVWEYPSGVGDPNLVRVHIANLRAKIDLVVPDKNVIVNVRGKGYMFTF